VPVFSPEKLILQTSLLITNARIVTSEGTIPNGWLFVESGRISGFGAGNAGTERAPGQIINAQGLSLLPGFIDVHVHGGVGHEVMDANPEGLQQLARFYAEHGVTGFLATTWTDSQERIMRALDVVAESVGPTERGATILGAHLEGPYLNRERAGAQNARYVRVADQEEAVAILDSGVIRLVSLAPEFEENLWLVQECARRGITASVAHTGADYAQMIRAIDSGITHATHTFNAMGTLHHREPGVIGAVLTRGEVRCELIADNIHVHPAILNLVYLAKGIDHVILISDAIRGAGMPDGEYAIDERVIVVKDGSARLPDGTLAGSVLTMDRALRNFAAATGESAETLWKVVSLNPAKAAGVAERKGSIERGKDADLVLLNGDVNVRATIVEGRVVFNTIAASD
jgi:N-acetylglucosamine-6-phosphate deacetylase